MSWLAPTSEPFHAESVNRADFQYKQGERQQPIRPKNEIERNGGAFAGESSSRDAFKAWEPQPRYRHQPPAYQKPEGSMDMRTTYGNQFASEGHKAYARLPPIRPESQHRQGGQRDAAFAGSTEAADSFPSYRRAQLAEAKQASFRPARPYQRPDEPFEARSSYSGDFATAGADGAEKSRPVRHEDQLRLSTEPMETRSSVSSSQYGAGVVGTGGGGKREPIVHRSELTVTGAGPFAVETTQRGDFAALGGPQQPRREPIRPSGELSLSVGGSEPFAARTVAQEDFAARPAGERPAPVKPRGELELSREPMAAATTSRDVYTPKTRDEPPPTRRRQQQQQPQQNPQQQPQQELLTAG